VEKAISLGDLGLTLGLDVFNLLGDRSVLWREADLGVGRAGLADEIVAPRTFRLAFGFPGVERGIGPFQGLSQASRAFSGWNPLFPARKAL